MLTAIEATVGNTLKTSSSSRGGYRPLAVPNYDGTRGAEWRDLMNKLLNEEYQFIYSKANGDFIRYFNSQSFDQSSFSKNP